MITINIPELIIWNLEIWSGNRGKIGKIIGEIDSQY